MKDTAELVDPLDLDESWPVEAYMRTGIARLGAQLPHFADPANLDEMRQLLGALHRAGRTEQALGRLFEGHLDALQIIHRYGTPAQAATSADLADRGATFGVWNAPMPGEPLDCENGKLSGGKAFASGAGILSHALVTTGVGDPARVQLWLCDLQAIPPSIDRTWWKTVGMARSETHLVRWHGASVGARAIGAEGDYERQPWFSGGMLRFSAVHAGGIARIFDEVRTHLIERDRAADPHQSARLGRLFGLADGAAAKLARTADAWFTANDEAKVALVGSARAEVTAAAEEAIRLAQQAVGLQALFSAHPLAAIITDLMVYLRQPGPDTTLDNVGQAAASGLIRP